MDAHGRRNLPWLTGLCTVLFDIDIGATVQHQYPPNALSAEEKDAVSFHAFPESMSMELHLRSSVRDSTFFFRIRRVKEVTAASSATASSAPHGHHSNAATEAKGPSGIKVSLERKFSAASDGEGTADRKDGCGAADGFLYGFVFCRQRQDSSFRRGGEQISVVLLSEYPFSSALAPLSQIAGELSKQNCSSVTSRPD